MLHWYKSTNTYAAEGGDTDAVLWAHMCLLYWYKSTCFTGTKGQIQLREGIQLSASVLGTFVGNALGSVYLLCWYKRTNSDAAEGIQLPTGELGTFVGNALGSGNPRMAGVWLQVPSESLRRACSY